MRKNAQKFFTTAQNCAILTPDNKQQNMNTVTLQIPLKEYGTIATLAAAAKMPLDKYITQKAIGKKTAEMTSTPKQD
jgi:hypothetical protein